MKSFREFKDEFPIEESINVPDEELWAKWRKFVNMSVKEIREFYDSDEGKTAGMKQGEADEAGIDSGRESARMLLKMLPIGTTYKKAQDNWTSDMWRWAKKQNSFIGRMKGMRKRMVGNPFERDGKKTRWLKSLMIWGHDPRK